MRRYVVLTQLYVFRQARWQKMDSTCKELCQLTEPSESLCSLLAFLVVAKSVSGLVAQHWITGYLCGQSLGLLRNKWFGWQTSQDPISWDPNTWKVQNNSIYWSYNYARAATQSADCDWFAGCWILKKEIDRRKIDIIPSAAAVS